MSKRHNVSRRRTYGRRQHELHERMDRRHDRRSDRTGRAVHDGGLDALSYEQHGAEAPYGFAD
jgi:hypothetical protein